jgi:LacI family transcriptional regulator
VTAKTREKVQFHLEALRYIPNHAARQMRKGVSSVYGLMTDAVATTPYSVDIVRGAQAALTDRHQTLLIASSDGDPVREAELWEMFRAHRVAGVVYASMFHRSHDVGRNAFRESIVLANCFAMGEDRSSIVPDDEQGGYQQAKYLLERGHRRVAIITLTPDIVATRLRSAGMRRAFQDAGVVFDESLQQRGRVGPIGQEKSVVYEVAMAMLQHSNRPSAVICGNDQVALQVYAAASHLGLAIPADLSVIGFDDLQLISESLYPKLTTVALPYFEIGRQAVELMNSAEGQEAVQHKRQSCRPLV